MKKYTTLLSLLLFTLLFTSCQKESLQSYLVKSQEKEGFISMDLPTSFLQLKSDDVADDVKQTLKSIKKINLLALPMNEDNKAAYPKEKATLKRIFKNKEYKSLARFGKKGMKINLFYTGNQDAIDEIIAFGYGDDAGVGVARILGKDMNPAKIMKMLKDVKFDGDQINVKQLKAIFNKK